MSKNCSTQAEFLHRDTIKSVSISGPLGEGSTQDAKLLVATWPESVRCKARDFGGNVEKYTWWQLWLVIVWSLEAVFWGKHPTHGPDGVLFPCNSDRGRLAGRDLVPGGMRGVMWNILGDIEFLVNDLIVICLAQPLDLSSIALFQTK